MSDAPAIKLDTMKDLLSGMVKVRHGDTLSHKDKLLVEDKAIRLGLIDENWEPTSLYYATMDDDLEKLARTLVGKPILCTCGCGREPKYGEFASKQCRFASRLQKLRDRKKRPN